jgi:ATP-dependent DNA helicase DinG
LLRDQNDFGVIVLCDLRITGKNYGSVFLKCLEPMRSTDSKTEVEQFLMSHEAASHSDAKSRQTA